MVRRLFQNSQTVRSQKKSVDCVQISIDCYNYRPMLARIDRFLTSIDRLHANIDRLLTRIDRLHAGIDQLEQKSIDCMLLSIDC